MASDVEIEEIIAAVKSLNETLESLIKYGKDAVAGISFCSEYYVVITLLEIAFDCPEQLEKILNSVRSKVKPDINPQSAGTDLIRVLWTVWIKSTEDFVSKKIGKLFGLATGYKACLQRLGLTSKNELERKISRHARNPELRELGSELLDLEHDWDTFLHSVDKTLEGENRESVQLGETGPIDVEVDDIKAASGQIIIVSFGLKDGAKLWLEDTNVPFPMVLDSTRKIYHAFGLHRSVQKVWGVVSMVYYGEAMLTGKPLPKPYENVHDDTQQMGGDFILDKDGVVRFLYPSQTNTDRPSVENIIKELKKIQGS